LPEKFLIPGLGMSIVSIVGLLYFFVVFGKEKEIIRKLHRR